MKEKFLPLAAVVLMISPVFAFVPTSAESASKVVEYTGQGFSEEGDLETVKCDPFDTGQASGEGLDAETGYLKWVLTASGADSAQLNGPWGSIEMAQAGGGAWHAATEYYELDDLTGEVNATHDSVRPGDVKLTVSNGCEGEVLNGEQPEPQDTTLNFQKVVCDSDVDLSEYQNAPDNPAGVDTPVTPLEEGDLPEGCSFDTANWDFELSVDGDESTYTASESVSFSHLFDELGAGAAKLFGAGNQLEVAEVEQEGYDFFALSCHQDALNSDNLEYIFHSEVERFDNIWCRAWNTTEVVVEPEPTVAQFSVTKEVEGDEPVDPFEFTWECTVGFDRPMDFSVMNGVYAYDGSFDLSDGETYESDELMLRKGMELDCEVAETETRGADSVSNSLNGEEVAEFTLEAGQTQEITFTNVFEPEVLADDDEIEEDPTPDAEPEVLGAEAQVVAPKGAVDAGASSSALLGLLSSIALVVAGFATRRFVG